MISRSKAELHRSWNKTRRETGYRSQFEKDLSDSFPEDVKWEYETTNIPYEVRHICKYKPDFIFTEQCFFLEAKGYFSKEDRDKILLVLEQHPGIDIRMVFYKDDHITKSLTYSQWCDKHNIPWSIGTMPPSWKRHKPSKEQRKAFYDVFTGDSIIRIDS